MKTALYRLYKPEYLVKTPPPDDGSYDTKRVYTSLLRFSWPAALEAVLIGLLTFVDTIMVGQVSPAAIAAVGVTNQPRFIFFAVFFALNVGVTAIVSRRKGEDDRESANLCLGQAFSICVLLSIVLCAASIVFARPLLRLAGAGDDIIDDAAIFFDLTMVGMTFTALTMVMNAAQRGSGNTRIALVTNLAANIVNITLDWLLICGHLGFPRLEVKGSGIATLSGNIVGFIIALVSVLRKGGYIRLSLKNCRRPDMPTIRRLFKISSSAASEQLFIRIGFFIYAMLVAKLGTEALATHQICMSIINLSYCVGDGLGMGAAALVGQSLGRKRADLAAVYGKASQRIGLLVSVMLVLVFLFGGRFLLILFTDEAPIIAAGIKLLYIVAISSPFQISNVVYTGCLRGAGDTKYVAVSSFISIGVIRPFMTWLFCYAFGLGLIGAWLSLLLDQIMRYLFAMVRFSRGKWKNIKV